MRKKKTYPPFLFINVVHLYLLSVIFRLPFSLHPWLAFSPALYLSLSIIHASCVLFADSCVRVYRQRNIVTTIVDNDTGKQRGVSMRNEREELRNIDVGRDRV